MIDDNVYVIARILDCHAPEEPNRDVANEMHDTVQPMLALKRTAIV